MGLKIKDLFVTSILNGRVNDFTPEIVNDLNKSFFGKKKITKKDLIGVSINGILFSDYLKGVEIDNVTEENIAYVNAIFYNYCKNQCKAKKHLYIEDGKKEPASFSISKPSLPWYVSFFRLFKKDAYQERYNQYQRELNTYQNNKNIIEEKFTAELIHLITEEPKEKKQIQIKDNKIEKNVNINKQKVIDNLTNENEKENNIKIVDTESLEENENNLLQAAPDSVKNLYKFPKKTEMTEEIYAQDIMSKKTGLTICNENVDLITLASFNIDELLELKEFINNKEEFADYVRAIDYKLGRLMDEDITNEGPNFNAESGYKSMKKCYNFVCRQLWGGVLMDQVNTIINEKIDIYNLLGMGDEQIGKDDNVVTSSLDRLTMKQKLEQYEINPSTGPKSVQITENKDRNEFVLNVEPTEKQSTDNGCWSCSFGMLLKHYNVDVNQSEIRGYRPDLSMKNCKDEELLKNIREKMNFAYRSTRDKMNTLEDYSDLATKSIKNCSVNSAQITNEPGFLLEIVEQKLKETKAPISLYYGHHYRTIIGVEDGHLILEDSNVRPILENDYHYATTNNDYYQNKYPNNSVIHVTCFKDQVGLTWLEQIKDPTTTEYYDEKISEESTDPQERFLRKETLSFEKSNDWTDENGYHSVQIEVQLPKSYVKTVYAQKNMVYPFDNIKDKNVNNIDNKKSIVVNEANILRDINNNNLDKTNKNEFTKNENKKIDITQEMSKGGK